MSILLICWWKWEILSSSEKIKQMALPSFFMPALKHFFSLQYLHWFRLSLSTMHCLLNLQNEHSEFVCAVMEWSNHEVIILGFCCFSFQFYFNKFFWRDAKYLLGNEPVVQTYKTLVLRLPFISTEFEKMSCSNFKILKLKQLCWFTV